MYQQQENPMTGQTPQPTTLSNLQKAQIAATIAPAVIGSLEQSGLLNGSLNNAEKAEAAGAIASQLTDALVSSGVITGKGAATVREMGRWAELGAAIAGLFKKR
jgi:hypothetical protein